MAAGPGPQGSRPRLEVSDLVIAFDPRTGERLPVARDEVVDRLRAAGDRRAARLVARLPVDDRGHLQGAAVDEVLVRMHVQLQRLWEELRQAQHSAALLRAVLAAVRAGGPAPSRRLRVVDVGSGLGYFVRWVAGTGALGADVDLIGCDLDPVLVVEARRLAEAEGLACHFEVGDALALSGGVDVFVSSGLLHHLSTDELAPFFAGQAAAPAFLHWDPVPTYLAPLGARIFHRARMRDPLARHDGVRSIQRAHPDRVLLDAVAQGAPAMATALFGLPNRWLPVLDVVRPVIGLDARLVGSFVDALGPSAARLVPERGPW